MAKRIEGNWLYLLEDEECNLKLGFSADICKRLYAYRDTKAQRGFRTFTPNGKFWTLGVRPGTRSEETEFHKAHADERILGTEWYTFHSRAAALLLLQNWQSACNGMVLADTEGPHYRLVHNKTTSDLASLLSRSRINKRGAAIVLHECPHCSKKYGARELRQHRYVCNMRPGNKPRAVNHWPSGEFGPCVHSLGTEISGFHATSYRCPICNACVCQRHKGTHNKAFHLK
jgi:hypothetical protein